MVVCICLFKEICMYGIVSFYWLYWPEQLWEFSLCGTRIITATLLQLLAGLENPFINQCVGPALGATELVRFLPHAVPAQAKYHLLAMSV